MVFLLALLLSQPLPPAGRQDDPPPKRPAERFTIYVDAGPQAASTTESIERVVEEVANRIGKRKKWLFVTDNPEKAEVHVQVLGHRVRQEHVTTLGTRVRYQPRSDGGGAPIDFVDTNYVSERHYLQASIRVLGLSRMIVGHDGKKKGASLERAASGLAEELEEFLKANYWELVERRRNRAAAGLELPRADAPPSASGSPPSPPATVGPLFARYLPAVEIYRQGHFIPAALAISTLTPAELYRMGTLFLAEDRTASELKAAALLHTECVVTLPQRAKNPLDLARRTAQHLELAKRYAQALPDAAERRAFQKRWHLATAYYFYRDLRSTESESLLASGLQIFPGDPDLLYTLGAFREASGSLGGDPNALREAESIYRTLAESGADLPELEVRLAHVLLRLGRMDEAERRLSAADSDNGDSLPVWMLRGDLALRRGRWGDAQDSFAKALEVDGACQACAVGLVSTFERAGQRDAAARFVAEWLLLPAPESRDGWWRFLLGPAAQFETRLTELRSEVVVP